LKLFCPVNFETFLPSEFRNFFAKWISKLFCQVNQRSHKLHKQWTLFFSHLKLKFFVWKSAISGTFHL
jgi:hypothetical protein